MKNSPVLHTFDVFDTTILRSVAQPVGIFALMQEELAKNCYNDIPKRLRENFFCIRVNSELLASRSRYQELVDLGEPTLERIYRYIGIIAKLTEEQQARLCKLEKDIEFNCSRLNNDVATIIDELIANGKRIAFISDMYLSSEFIKTLVCKSRPNYKDIPLYVSNELGFGKSKGKAFEKVAAIENVPINSIMHRGDNVVADFDGALLAGATAEIVNVEPLLPYEKLALDKYQNNAYIQLAIGSAHIARKKSNTSKSYEVGSSFAAPVLFPYVWYILSTSKSLGIKKILFIARDGYILKMIADTILQSQFATDFEGIETSYFYASRKVWLTEDTEEQELAQKYIEQEVRKPDGSIPKFAFVDLHGSGRSVSCAVKLAKSFYNDQIPCFYYTTLLINEKYLQEYFPFCQKYTEFIEMLCRSANGKTIGYKNNNGQIIPILNDTAIFPNNFSFDEYKAGIYEFTQIFLDTVSYLNLQFDNSILSEFYIDYATLTLNNEIAEFFGQILFDAVPNSTEAEKGCVYAKKPTKRELLNMFLLRPIGKRPKHYCHSFNDEIAMLLCSNTSRKLIAFYNKHYNSLLGKLARKIFPEPVPIPWLNKSGEVIETLKARNFKMIMIYGSGKIGMEMIREVKKNKLTVAGISDKNYSKMKNVINPNELLNHKFDVIFVCIANKAVSAQAKMELLALGIENNRIVEYANPPSTPQSAVSRCQ